MLIRSSLVILFFLSFFNCKKQAVEDKSRVEALPFFNEATFTPKWISPDSKKLKDFHKIPSFEFINQNGNVISDKTFNNKIYVTDFFFTTCPVLSTHSLFLYSLYGPDDIPRKVGI